MRGRSCEDTVYSDNTSIITLAHDLNLQVIAEGVETPQQYAQFQALGCEFGQGRLFAHGKGFEENWPFLQESQPYFGGINNAASSHRPPPEAAA